MSSTSTPWQLDGMQEGHRPLGSLARLAVDELHTVRRQPVQARREVGDLEADVVEALALVGQETGHPGGGVGGLDELDLGLADGQERDAHTVALDGQQQLQRQPQGVAVEAQRGLHVTHDDGHVMDAARGRGWRPAASGVMIEHAFLSRP